MSEANTNNQNQNNEQNQQGQQNQQQGTDSQQTTPSFDYDKLAEIINGKQSVAEETVLKNYFKNQGLSSDEMKQAIAAFKEQKAKNTPDVGQLQASLNSAQSDLLTAQINAVATKAALKQGVPIDSVEYLLRMADFKAVTDENGNIKEDSVTAVIKDVLEKVPALKGTQQQGGSGFTKIGGDGKQQEGTDEDMLRGIFGIKKK